MKNKSELIKELVRNLPEEFKFFPSQEHYKKCFEKQCEGLTIGAMLNRFTVAWLNYYYEREHSFDYREKEEKRIKDLKKIFCRCLVSY